MEEYKNQEIQENSEENKEVEEVKEEQELQDVQDNVEEISQDQSEVIQEKKADDISGEYTGTSTGLDNAYFNPIRYVDIGNCVNFDDEIDKVRNSYAKKLGKGRIFDFVSIGVMILSFAGVILVTMLNTNSETAWLTWVVLGTAVALIIASFLLTTIMNKKSSKIAKEYLNVFEDTFNGYTISSLNISEPVLCVDAKIDDQLIIQSHYFSTINRIDSRGIVEGKRNDREFVMGEVAVVIPTTRIEDVNRKPEDLVNLDGSHYVKEIGDTATGTTELSGKDMTILDMDIASDLNQKQAKKKEKDQSKKQADTTATGLFGKYISYDMKVDSEESIIVSFMGAKIYTVLPTYTAGFKAVFVPGLRNNVVVYATNPRKAAKFFNNEGVELLNNIKTNNIIQSGFLSINSYGCKAGITLSDDIMVLPLKELKSRGAYELFRDTVEHVFDYFDFVEKNKD